MPRLRLFTIDSLQGEPIADYAHSLFNDWDIGHKADNRGMLILLAKNDRKYYIAVGRGFEKLFPNGRVAAIGKKMTPDLKEQHYSDAVLKAAEEIAGIIAQERKVVLSSLAQQSI